MTKSEVVQAYAERHNLPCVDVKLNRPKTRCPKTGRFIAAPKKSSVPSEGPIQYSLGENLAEWQRAEVRRRRVWDQLNWFADRLAWVGVGILIAVLVMAVHWILG